VDGSCGSAARHQQRRSGGQATTEQAAGWAFYDQSFKYLVYLDPSFDNNHHSAVDRRGVVNGVSLARLEARTQAGRGAHVGVFCTTPRNGA
jgi:hypothetical protein